MKRTTACLLIVTCAALLAAAVVLLRSPDPAYRLQAWRALGRFERHDALIAEIAAKHGLDPLLVKAIVWHESAFDAARLSPDGARGLMQLGEGTAAEWAAAHSIETFMPADLFDPHTNLDAGCWYLARVLAHWRHRDDAVPFALAEYQAGRKAVMRWAGITGTAADLLRTMDDPAARGFVASVLNRRHCYALP